MGNKWKTVNQIREFNRFYTVLLGFLNHRYLDSAYSVTETRILFELLEHKQTTANNLIEILHLDKSYISRLIRNFERKGLIMRQATPADRRSLSIQLTQEGRKETEQLITRTNSQILALLEPLACQDCQSLCTALQCIIDIFSRSGQQEESHETQ